MTPAHKPASPIYAARDFLNRYMVFTSPDYALVCALYAAATHMWTHFDAFPYLHITKATKRAGGTRLSELLSFMVANPVNVAGATAASIFRRIEDDKPTLFIDEAENLSSENSPLRTVLNVGYRKGQTMSRVDDRVVKDFETYCPKVFIGIGDLYDTLRDRTIVVRLTRGTPAERFLFAIASTDGERIRDQLADYCRDNHTDIYGAYTTYVNGLSFLSDRDAELWAPIFAVCHGLAPELLPELERIAVDMSTEKTAVARKHYDLKESEEQAQEREYGEHLLRDMVTITKGKKHITSADALDQLKAIPTAPWRKFRGDGLTLMDIARLLKVHGVRPRYIKQPPKSKSVTLRGYTHADLEKAASAL